MEVPSSFAQRLADIAGSTPRNVLENLLMGLAPRVPVKARTIPTDSGGRVMDPLKLDADGMVVGPTTRERMMVRKLVRGPRTRQPRGRDYETLDHRAYRNHRAGTWTHAMVSVATGHALSNTNDAVLKLRELYPQYADRNIDFNWLAKVGYIRF